ncbi:MAG: six-cysteine ranthipeptide SCIFF [bacterium]
MREELQTKQPAAACHVELIDSPEVDLHDSLRQHGKYIECRACASSCQSACKTSCTVANQPCERTGRER